MKNLIKWIFIAILIFTCAGILFHFLKADVKKTNNENAETEMLQVQAKVEVEFEKYHVNNENGLKGEKLEELDRAEEFGITDLTGYYKWTKEILDEVGLTQSSIKEGEYYLVNYDLNEVIYSEGITMEDGNVFYKLSDIENSKKANILEEQNEVQEQIQEEGENVNEGSGEEQAE